MNQNSKQPTLKTIAEAAGCSRNTVSLALRGSNRISDATRDRIEKIAEKAEVPNMKGIPFGLNYPFQRALKAINGEELYYRWGEGASGRPKMMN